MSDHQSVKFVSRPRGSVIFMARYDSMKRRKFGNVTPLPSGKYRARYTGPDGVMHKAPATFHDESDALAWLRNEEKLIAFDTWTPPERRSAQSEARGVTVGDWMGEWLEMKQRDLKPSTYQNYVSTVERRITKVPGKAGRLSRVALVSLSRMDVVDWWDAISSQFDTAPYNHNAYLRLKAAMDDAVERNLLASNPVSVKAGRKKPKPVRKELPDDDVLLGIVGELTDRYRLLGILTLFHGLRIGEALALRRQDVSATHVKVSGTAYRVEGGGMVRLDSPKTDSGRRSVPIFSRWQTDVEHHLRYHVGDDLDAPLFTTPTGMIVMDTTYRAAQNAAKKRAGYSHIRITPHYGRVWLITALAEAGMPIPAIGQILGQTDLKTITEVYMRSSDEATSIALKAMNDRLAP